MYSDIVLHHYRFPKNKGVIKNPDSQYTLNNPYCGDSISIFVNIKKRIITEIRFNGVGCAISIATASLLSEYVYGKSIAVLKKLDATFIRKLIQVELSPNRLKCALLPLEVLQKALIQYERSKTEGSK